jgi:hypothetical protein
MTSAQLTFESTGTAVGIIQPQGSPMKKILLVIVALAVPIPAVLSHPFLLH